MTTPYNPVTWSYGERPTQEKLNQMAANEQWLFEQTPRMVYNANSLKKEGGLKIIAGLVPTPIQAGNVMWVNIYFGSTFSSGCNPVVNTTVGAGNGYSAKYTSLAGLDDSPVIDNRGCKVLIIDFEAPIYTGPFFYRTNYIHFLAVGW